MPFNYFLILRGPPDYSLSAKSLPRQKGQSFNAETEVFQGMEQGRKILGPAIGLGLYQKPVQARKNVRKKLIPRVYRL